ncbi:MAG: M48 family metallopeptidase [Clostridia bacterium]|nr:M48 family metallopeptidase [Clostridia bacterium]
MIKYLFIGLILLDYLWKLFEVYLSAKQMKKPLPACVQGIYDEEQYNRWVSYTHEKRRFSLISGAINTALMVAILAFDLLAVVYNAFDGWMNVNGYADDALMVVVFCLFFSLAEIIPDYIFTFRIEEKYGFNKSTKKTFWGDTVKNTILSLVINLALCMGAALLYDLISLWLIVGIFAGFILVLLVSSVFALPLQKLFYRFDPLEDGSLKDRINHLFVSNGYQVRSIYVMNASKRTTRANAFCTGIGKGKKIALFDNLVNNYSEDEITAVFAHELGHDKHKDTAVMVLLQTVIYAVISVLIGLTVASSAVSMDMGFAEVNAAAMVLVLSMAALGPLMTLLMIPFNMISRHMERRADTFAADCGLGQPLMDALKRLSRDNLTNLNPHPFLATIGYSHPAVGERVQVIEKAMIKRGERPPAAKETF